MNKSGLNLMLLAAAVIVVSIALAGLLSLATPKDAYMESAGSSAPGNTIGESTDDPADEDVAPSRPEPEPVKGGLAGGNPEAAKEGRLPGYEDKEINADPDTFCYLINSDVTQEKPGGMANVMAENDPGNVGNMQLCYYLEETGELIYVSPMLQPGYHVNGDSLSVKLKKGSYKVSAAINVYDEETKELKTTFHQDVTITVKQKFLGIF